MYIERKRNMDPFFNLAFQEDRLIKNIFSLPEIEKKNVLKAYELAKKYHSGQKRDEGVPYILHPLRVANLLVEELGINNVSVLCAALLHDTVEDSSLELEKIKGLFSRKTAQLVKNLTRRRPSDESEVNKYEYKYQKFLETKKKDFNTRAVKACDFLDNMMSWSGIPKGNPARKKFERWFREAESMYIPLARTVDQKLVNKMNKILVKAQGENQTS